MNRNRTPEVCLFSFLAGSSLLASSSASRAAALRRRRTQALTRLILLLTAAALGALLAGCGSSKSSTQVSTLGDGTYVFHLSGVDYYTKQQYTSPYFVAGVFTVSNGLITQGEEDFVDYNGAFPQAVIDPALSGITRTADGNLQITLYTGINGPVILGINGVQTINATLVSSSSARIAEFDASASGTGSLDLQSSPAQPSGSYAFFAAGLDKNQLPMAMGGIVSVDDLNDTTGTISGAGSEFDLNDGGTTSPEYLFGASTVSAPDSFGRVVFKLNPSSSNPTAIPSFQLVGYVVDSNTIQLVETTDGLLGTTGGTALSQSGTSLNPGGSTYVFSSLGQEQTSGQFSSGTGFLNFAGEFAFDNTAGVSGQVSFNDIASQLANGNTNTANWSAETTPNGHIMVTGLTTSLSKTPANLVFYLDGNGNALVISMDATDVTAGVAFQQAANPSVSGNYALTAQGTTTVTSTTIVNGVTVTTTAVYPWAAVGDGSAASGKASGFTDLNALANPYASGSLTSNVALSGTSSGTGGIMTGTIGGLGYANTSNAYVYYVIDNNRALAIETDANQLSEAFAIASSK